MQKSHIKEITFKMKQEIKIKRDKSQSVQTEETENTWKGKGSFLFLPYVHKDYHNKQEPQ